MTLKAWRRRRRPLWARPRLEELESRDLLSAIRPDPGVLPAARIVRPLTSATPDGLGFTPAQLQHAYGFDNIVLGGGIVGDGSGQTIAIIDAFDNPRLVNSTDPTFAQSDLHQFDVGLGLPDPPSFVKVNQTGGSSYPRTDKNWADETALDVEWAHALAPGASILLVEASDDTFANLDGAAIAYARKQPGVSVVSLSFGTPEAFDDLTTDALFRTPAGHAGVTFVASAGDDGIPAVYPALSPNVLGVGGTTLHLDAAGNYQSESAWKDSGGGYSQVETVPAYQAALIPGAAVRMAPDVAFDADPNTGVPIYDSLNNGAATPWDELGGTSFAAPAWAALIAIADQARADVAEPSLDGRTQTLPLLYRLPTTAFHDVTTGSNGYPAHAGYDLVTGRGTPVADRVVAGLISPPTIAGLSQTSAPEGSPDLVVTVNGTGFETGSVASLGANPLATSFLSASQLQVTIPASLLTEVRRSSLTVTNKTGPALGTSNAVVFPVTEAALTADPSLSVVAAEGLPAASVRLATFTDPDPNDAASEYQAWVYWGDGTPVTLGTVSALGSGHWVVSGTHTYAEDHAFTITVVVRHATAPVLVIKATATVSEGALAGTGTALSLTEGHPFYAVVAAFTDADPTKPPTAYRATVSWGDGTAATAAVIQALGGGRFAVWGAHTYTEEGPDTLTITVRHDTAPALVLTSTATTADALVTSLGSRVAVPAGKSFTTTVAWIFDADPLAPAADYAATVDWGDSTATTPGKLVPIGIGTFAVTGTHVYSSSGVYAFRVTVSDAGGRATLATGTAAAGIPLPARHGVLAIGADAGSLPVVSVLDETGRPLVGILAYESTFRGGVRVATGVLGGKPVVVTAPGPTHAPLVKIYNRDTGALLGSFQAFGGTFTGGLSVALGDLNGDGVPDLAVGQGSGSSAQIEAFDGTTLLTTHGLLAAPFTSGLSGGVSLAIGGGELVVGAGPGGPPQVNVYTFDGTAFNLRKSFNAFDSGFTGGVFVAVGDFNGDGTPDLIAGAGPGGPAQVNVFDGSQLALDTSTPPPLLTSFVAYGGGYTGGVRVAAITGPGGGPAAIWTGFGKGEPDQDLRSALFAAGTTSVFDRVVPSALFAGGAFVS
jgi:hypothetical protein